MIVNVSRTSGGTAYPLDDRADSQNFFRTQIGPSMSPGNETSISPLEFGTVGPEGYSMEELLGFLSQNFSFSPPQLGMSEKEQLFITLLYGTAIAVALMGNLAVILVFFFGRRWDSDLSVFLVNLAFSDIILAVFCMPFTMSQVVKHHWPFADVLCPIVMFLQLSSVISSVYTLVAVGADRYFFVTRPLEARFTRRRGRLVVTCIWGFAVSLSSIQLAVVRCSDFMFNGQVYKDCQEEWASDQHRKIYTATVALLTYILPLLILVFTYHRIGRVLWHQVAPGESLLQLDIAFPAASTSVRATDDRRVMAKQRMIKMLVIVVLIFAICWLPLHFLFLAVDFFPDIVNEWRSYGDGVVFAYTFLAIHFLAMSSSYTNPLIYSFMSQNFRYDIIKIWQRASSSVKNRLCRLCTEDKNATRNACIYSSMQHHSQYSTFSQQRHHAIIVIHRIFSHPTPSVSACRLERRKVCVTCDATDPRMQEQ